MRKRESGLDLLRCLGLLLVVIFHFFLFNGYATVKQWSISMWLAGCCRCFSLACNGLFLMLTGYLKSERTDLRSCYRGLATVLIGYFLAAAVSIPLRHFVLGEVQPLKTWAARFLNFSGVYYGWYVKMYLGLILLSPFVNMTLKHLQDKRLLFALAAVLLLLTAVPGMTPWIIVPEYWRAFYPLTYYVLGGILRRLQPKVRPWLAMGGAIAMAVLMGTVTALSQSTGIGPELSWDFGDLWVVVIAVCLFVALYRVKPPAAISRVLAFGASGCYGGYLLSYLLDAGLYRQMPHWGNPEFFFWVILKITLPIFLISTLLGVLLQKITDALLIGFRSVVLHPAEGVKSGKEP